MQKTEYKYIVVDKVEDSEIDGKPARVATDKGGFVWHFGEHTKDNWHKLVPGAKLQLHIENKIIKHFNTVHEALKDKYPKNNKQSSTSESIEAQVATYNITELLIHKEEVPNDIKDMYWDWFRKVYKNGG